ncbi:hypothetical protein, partial [Bacteroides sp. 519]|uniref:hypothetical protein n=1 Tax=Bacteroides sp. 519 TaxID=2302937 RepID=UPI0013D4FAF4
AKRYGWKIFIPKFGYTTDNAAMVATLPACLYVRFSVNCVPAILVIDKRTEVILTSGFDHLGSTTNEFSYIVQPGVDTFQYQ